MLLAHVEVLKKLICISLFACSGKYDFIGQGDDTVVPGFLRLLIWNELVDNLARNNVRIYNNNLLSDFPFFFFFNNNFFCDLFILSRLFKMG